MPRTPRRLVAGSAVLLVVGATAVVASAPANAVSSSVVISQVYGGGGNAGATYKNDFVQLFNGSTSPVDVTGWTIGYFPATSTGPAASLTTLSGTIAAGHSYLVQMAAGAGGTADLPTPDAVGAALISGTAGRIDVFNDVQQLVDRVGFGTTATTFEGSGPAPAPSNTTAVVRNAPCTDTDNNAADFATAPPAPENSATATPACTAAPPTGQPATIEQIQGATHTSPLKDQLVTDVQGVVTAKGPRGFWFQSTTPDADDATSDGVYVFTSSAPAVAVGDAVSVDATVTEFFPGAGGLSTTELTRPTVAVASSGNSLPAPVVLGVDRVAPAQTIKSGAPGDVQAAGVPFSPTTDAMDFDESLEGMRVAVAKPVAVGPTNTGFGETPIIPGGSPDVIRSARGGVVYSGYDHPNGARLIMDDQLLPAGSVTAMNVGDKIKDQAVGVLDYDFSNFHLNLTAAPTVKRLGLQREVTDAPSADQLAVATFNVENLAPADPQTKFDRLAAQIVTNLRSPDLLAVEEIQDNSGATNDGTVASDLTVSKLVAAIRAAGGPKYKSQSIDPVDGADGGQPGGNIRQVFLYRTDRGLGFVQRDGGTSTTPVTVEGVGAKTHLSVSPGRIDPANTAWNASRKPLVGQFKWNGQPLFVIANHLNSKGGDNAVFGRYQPPVRSSEVQRHQQAQLVHQFVANLQQANSSAKIIVLGDINDFEFSQTADLLVGGINPLVDLPRTLPKKERYTYVFDGNSQVLDHILISGSLAKDGSTKLYEYDAVHTNSEFFDQDSDHDPQVVRLDVR
ncbi:lamin tail domain-containing protein [Angustibacter luteus]|uniref:Lamin tail domain-containing protein n=1 Tax=Angustibacter luteus TaxID=658456 RepID=A0ABW1J8Z0_9ACTN